MKNSRHVFWLLLLIVFIGCQEERPTEDYSYSKKVVIAKTKEVNRGGVFGGHVRYFVAFNDGYTKNTTFGYYTCLNVGDTVDFKYHLYREYWTWIPNCK